ncbi:MAG: FadR family transcriptional regulator [Spirochaetales bacterium]|nr:FadR family transcriptional regulator [Spirochaetales bacterium]
MDFKPIKQKTVVAQVMEQIKELISSGQYKPGDRFPTEFELAEMFGLGRSSIREAIKIFQHLGVLQSKVPRGTYVCDSSNISKEALTWSILLGNTDFYDLLEFRLVMEQQGLWYILVYRKDDTAFKNSIIKKLHAEIRDMENAIEAEDYVKRLEADYRFHKHIIEACENQLFDSIYMTLQSFLREEIRQAQNSKAYILKSPQNHQELVNSIIEGDYQNAAEAYRQHIHNVNEVFNHHRKLQEEQTGQVENNRQ